MKSTEIEMQSTPRAAPKAGEVRIVRSGKHWHFADLQLPLNNLSSHVLEGVTGNHLEILARFEPNTAQEFGVNVLLDPDFPSAPEVSYHRRLQRFGEHDLPLTPGDALSIHILVNDNVIATRANESSWEVHCVDGLSPLATHVGLFCWGGPVTVSSVDIWEIDLIGE